MILCLDVGNTQIEGGVFSSDNLQFQFRRSTRAGQTSDEFGLFFRSILRENDIDPKGIRQIAICTVVPEVLHSIRNACLKYFNIQPFVLQPGVKTGLQIRYRNPLEVGADRIANAVAAIHLYPGQDIVVIDFGTATTFDVVTKQREYLGGAILPGLKIAMNALVDNTSKLPSVEIVVPETVIGRSTQESIQSGLFFGHLGAIREILRLVRQEQFDGRETTVLATGGFSSLFERGVKKHTHLGQVFDEIIPDLVLRGLYLALKANS